MNLLILDSIEPEVGRWLSERHAVRFAADLVREPSAVRGALALARAAIVPPTLPVDAAFLRQAPALRAVGRIGNGVDLIDGDACAQAAVEVVRAPLAPALAEAEFIVGALLQLLRGGVGFGAGGSRGSDRELGGCTVGLVGLTPTARGVVQILGGFGSRVVGYDPGVHASDAVWSRWQVVPLGLGDVLANSDAVCMLLPFYTRYRGLLGERLLARCKPRQVIVCTSASGLFDDAALAEALNGGVLAGAWLDGPEPDLVEPGRPLGATRNLVLTQRLAGHTRDAAVRSAWTVARRLDELLEQAGAAAMGAQAPAAKPPVSPATPVAAADPAGGPAVR